MKSFILKILLLSIIFQGCQKEDISLEQEEPETFNKEPGELKTGYYQGNKITYQEIDGFKVFEGDIVLRDEEVSDSPDLATNRSVGLINKSRLWPNGIVYYNIDPSVASLTSVIMEAINHYHAKTDIRFVRGSDPSDKVKKPLLFTKSYNPKLALSTLGYYANGNCLIWLPTGLSIQKDIVIHEIGHTLGCEHEHSRWDRDKYIKIHWDNIKPEYRYAFEKTHAPPPQNQQTGSTAPDAKYSVWDTPFDFNSTMMYETNAGAIDLFKPTITTIRREGESGKPYSSNNIHGELSAYDIAGLSQMYGFDYYNKRIYIVNKTNQDWRYRVYNNELSKLFESRLMTGRYGSVFVTSAIALAKPDFPIKITIYNANDSLTQVIDVDYQTANREDMMVVIN